MTQMTRPLVRSLDQPLVQPLIQLQHVSQAFFIDRKKTRARIALRDVNLDVNEGEFVSLIGPSGCGKTVTLSLMAGFMTPVEGKVLFQGESVCGPSPERGVVFQDYSLLPWLSVEGNIIFALRNSAKAEGKPFSNQQAKERARDALAQVGLADTAELRPNTLSGGMKQRVAIARLLAMDSDVFLMDEPFSALDEQTRSALDESLFQLWKERHKTIVFVTHNIAEAVRISSRIVLFDTNPGTILREWKLPENLERNLDSEEVKQLMKEIRDLLPVQSLE